MRQSISFVDVSRTQNFEKKSGQDRPSKILTPTAEKKGTTTRGSKLVETSDQKRGVGFSKKSKKPTLK